MEKNFDDLTIVDDYMFCTVMEDPMLCKELLSMLLKDKVGKIINLFQQKPIKTQIASKGVRLDIMIEDEHGKLYDVEMQTTDQKNLPERMRYYQCAIDNSAVNKGGDYNNLPDTFIIFLCTFDYLQKGLPLYTIIPSCRETGQFFNDGTTKIIANSTAAEHAEKDLKAFLSYMNGKPPETAFTKQLDQRVNETKGDEEKRREYMLLKSFEMDARRAGIAEGIQQGIQQGIRQGIQQGIRQGIQQGIQQGFADGSYRKALETAKIMLERNYPPAEICLMTGLSKSEIEKL